jgi:hypothetical protein
MFIQRRKPLSSNTAHIVRLSLFLLTGAVGGNANMIVNGTFETGNIAGWTTQTTSFMNVTRSCNRGFAAQTTASGCQPGINPTSGLYAAYSSTSFPPISNDVGEWDNFLNQNIVVPNTTLSEILSWSDSALWSGTGVFRGVVVSASILNGSTYLATQYSVADPNADGSEQWTNHSWDLTSIFQANPNATLTIQFGSSVFFDSRTLGAESFATTETTGFDNIALNATTAPEPSTFGLAAIALAGWYFSTRRCRASAVGTAEETKNPLP